LCALLAIIFEKFLAGTGVSTVTESLSPWHPQKIFQEKFVVRLLEIAKNTSPYIHRQELLPLLRTNRFNSGQALVCPKLNDGTIPDKKACP
jgi:hypothetical protein